MPIDTLVLYFFHVTLVLQVTFCVTLVSDSFSGSHAWSQCLSESEEFLDYYSA